MNRRILIALTARADLDDAMAFHVVSKTSSFQAVRLKGLKAMEDAKQMHASILQALSGVELLHYNAAEELLAKDSFDFDPKVEPKCEQKVCANPVKWICRCSRCESEGNDHTNRFYACGNEEHKSAAEASHHRMRDRECVWRPL